MLFLQNFDYIKCFLHIDKLWTIKIHHHFQNQSFSTKRHLLFHLCPSNNHLGKITITNPFHPNFSKGWFQTTHQTICLQRFCHKVCNQTILVNPLTLQSKHSLRFCQSPQDKKRTPKLHHHKKKKKKSSKMNKKKTIVEIVFLF